MKIQTTTLWTIEKDGVSVDLTLEDIAELLQDMIIMENLILFDSESGRCVESLDDIGITTEGFAVQLTIRS